MNMAPSRSSSIVLVLVLALVIVIVYPCEGLVGVAEGAGENFFPDITETRGLDGEVALAIVLAIVLVLVWGGIQFLRALFLRNSTETITKETGDGSPALQPEGR
jgi:hypothetical protein